MKLLYHQVKYEKSDIIMKMNKANFIISLLFLMVGFFLRDIYSTYISQNIAIIVIYVILLSTATILSLLGLYLFRKSVKENRKESISYLNNTLSGLLSGIFVAYAILNLVNKEPNIFDYAFVIAMLFIVLGLGSAVAVSFRIPKNKK